MVEPTTPNSIWIWEDLERVFVKNFEGTYKRPGGLTELQLCVQGNTESTRDYIQRWITLHNSVEGVSEFQAIHAFKQGVKYKELMKLQTITPTVKKKSARRTSNIMVEAAQRRIPSQSLEETIIERQKTPLLMQSL